MKYRSRLREVFKVESQKRNHEVELKALKALKTKRLR